MNWFKSWSIEKRFALALALLAVAALLAHAGILHFPVELLGMTALGGVGLQVVTSQVTAPGATITATAAAAGDSLQIQNGTANKRVWMLDVWAQNNAAGVLEIKSPRLHDNVRAMRMRITTADVFPLYADPFPQLLYPQDVLTVSLSGSAVGGQIEQASFLAWYEDLPGIKSRLTDWPTVLKSGINVDILEASITPGAGGSYTGAQAINTSFDNLIANTDYAVIGYEVDAKATSVCLRGPDTGNLRVGGPGASTLRDRTRSWFWEKSTFFGIPLIPVFNSANKATTIVDVATNQAATAVNISWCLVQLAPGAVA